MGIMVYSLLWTLRTLNYGNYGIFLIMVNYGIFLIMVNARFISSTVVPPFLGPAGSARRAPCGTEVVPRQARTHR